MKAAGSYELPWNLQFGANFRLQSGLPITRTYTVPACAGAVTTNCVRIAVGVNAEPRGSVTLPWLPTLDVRLGRFFQVNGNRLDVSVDAYNFTNENTVWGVRNGTGLTPIRVNGDPTAPTTQIATFLSPTNVLGPRVVRFNLTYSFGQR